MYTTTKHLPYLRPQQHKQQQQTELYQQPHHKKTGRQHQPVLNQRQRQRQFTQQQQQTVLYQQPHHSNIGRQPVLNQQQQQRQFTQQLEFHSRQISPSTLMMRHSGQK